MNNKKKNEIQKYTTIYMSIGMCFGISCGIVCENLSTGMAIGMCIGLAVGAWKDKRLTEKAMEITRIEAIEATKDSVLFVKDQSGTEKTYNISEKEMKKEKFEVGDRVAEETDGMLVSLESK